MTITDIISITPRGLWILAPLALWSLLWKGFALWRAATRHDKVWFILLLLLNTAGLLEILYLFVFSKREQHASTQKESAEPQTEDSARANQP